MKIVVGIGSEESAAAARAFLAGAKPSTGVMAVAVVPRPSRLAAVLEFPRRQAHRHLQELEKLEQKQALEVLASFKSAVERPEVKVETVVHTGDPSEELIRAARRWQADLILVARRQNDSQGKNHLGSVARGVARHASCSVLLLDPAAPSPKVVLLATDGSPESEQAGQRVRQLPLQGSPTLLVVTVLPSFTPAFVKSGSIEYREYQRLLGEIEDQEKEAAQQILDKSAASFRGTPFRVREMALTGDTTAVLLKLVRDHKVDLLTLGAKGVSATAEFLLGSVTLKVLNQAPCSILVAR